MELNHDMMEVACPGWQVIIDSDEVVDTGTPCVCREDLTFYPSGKKKRQLRQFKLVKTDN